MTAYFSSQMQDILLCIGWFSGAYLLGSIPVAWLLARWLTGHDLRRMGSGNVGVMNSALSVARWAGLLVFLTEIAKGLLAVTLPYRWGATEFMVAGSWVQ
jgi:glycerol-3-phosphate acyltransferase PlsY